MLDCHGYQNRDRWNAWPIFKVFTGHAEGLLDAFWSERQDDCARREGAAVDLNCGGGDDAVRRLHRAS